MWDTHRRDRPQIDRKRYATHPLQALHDDVVIFGQATSMFCLATLVQILISGDNQWTTHFSNVVID